MATRKNTFLLKRSNVAGNVPAAGQILLGELALNTADVILYASGTTTNSILPIGWDRVAKSGDTMTGTLIAPTISATTYQNLPLDIRVTGFTYNNQNTLTINDSSGSSFSVLVNTMTGLTATTLSAATYLGNGGSLTGISGSFGITIDGAGSVITSGVKGYVVMPYKAKIIGWSIVGNTSGNCLIDVWKNTTIPTVSDSITGSEKPNLTAQQINSDNNLTTWNVDINLDDIIAFNVISANTVSRINLIIKILK